MRRVDQRYVIATKTQVDINNVELPKRLDDQYFQRVDLKEEKNDADKLFGSETKVHLLGIYDVYLLLLICDRTFI